ncbi:MAG: hypothetical protein K2X48_19640 [Chitinophagaceae bacterium]|nr:hypothetical protein [Chitinophagaceae bacterium]
MRQIFPGLQWSRHRYIAYFINNLSGFLATVIGHLHGNRFVILKEKEFVALGKTIAANANKH